MLVGIDDSADTLANLSQAPGCNARPRLQPCSESIPRHKARSRDTVFRLSYLAHVTLATHLFEDGGYIDVIETVQHATPQLKVDIGVCAINSLCVI